MVADITLVIMAAGMGSRYGGIKQLEPVGPGGEIIMDYSIYDAKQAGFNKVVVIIRKDLEHDFKNIIGNRIEKIIPVEYVYQELDALPEGFVKPEGRSKPWGTGQAVLCCKDAVKGPFAVINADDYYGKEAFKIVYEFLNDRTRRENQYCMAGFILGNTLSENGAVTRGVCEADENGHLVDIVETSGIIPKDGQAVAKGGDGEENTINLQNLVSMNMWGFQTGLFDYLNEGFVDFLSGINDNDLKKEYLLPAVVDELIKADKAEVSVLKTNDRWFGVTYKEDKESVIQSIRALVDKGEYPRMLYV